MAQLVTRIDDRLAAAVDELVAYGVAASRSEVVRRSLEEFVEAHRRQQTGERIVAGYRRRPQRDDEFGWSDEASAHMIAEEPW